MERIEKEISEVKLVDEANTETIIVANDLRYTGCYSEPFGSRAVAEMDQKLLDNANLAEGTENCAFGYSALPTITEAHSNCRFGKTSDEEQEV